MWKKPIRFWRLDLLIHCYHVHTLQSTADVQTRSSLPSFLSILPHFPQTKIISHAQENIISTDAEIAHFVWRRKDSLSSKICSKHQEQQRRSSAARRYRWLACVLSQVVRTSSPGSRPRQFFPSLPTPRTGLLIPLKKLFYSQCWRVLWQFLLKWGANK